jgi:hypothetical protein
MGRYTVMGMFVSVVWRLLKKLKIELPYDPAVPFLGIYPKECKRTQSRYLSTQVHSTTLHNGQTMESA